MKVVAAVMSEVLNRSENSSRASNAVAFKGVNSYFVRRRARLRGYSPT
jgi:hypothetical protein